MIFDKKSSKHLPNHVAFIMDGNRRWAKINNLQIIEGHKKGSEVVKKIVKKSISFKQDAAFIGSSLAMSRVGG